MNPDALAKLLQDIINIGVLKLLYLSCGLWLMYFLKGVIVKAVNKAVLFFDKDIDVGRVIKIDNIHGIIRRMGFSETTIENDEYNWKIPNEKLIQATKGFPIQKKNKDEEDEDNNG